eukprot:s1972_g6.t1
MSGRKAVAHADKAMQTFTKAAQLGYLDKLCERVREARDSPQIHQPAHAYCSGCWAGHPPELLRTGAYTR